MLTDGLAVYIIGEGEPILVFPYPHAGTNEPMAQSDFSDTFLALGRQVITFDVPGAYASTREYQVDMNEMLGCALDALEAAGVDGKIDVAGHSMGGLVALAFALEYPEHVDQLLLINTLSGFDASLKWGMPGSAWTWNQKEYWQLMYWGIRLQNGRGNLAMHKRLMNLMQDASYVDKTFVPPLEIDEDDKEKYASFWKEFGKVLKEGPAEDFENRENIAKLMLFSTTHDDSETQSVSLQEYVDRMPKEQDKIYYVTIAQISNDIDLNRIESIDYESFLSNFSKPLELRKTDYKNYPVYAFMFAETTKDNFKEIEDNLMADLDKFIIMKEN